MNDHNLDDLIIDNIDPKNSKTKSFLTIIALAIVVLIVAIILTKIILKDPNQQLALEEDHTELISPELTLQSVNKEKPTTEISIPIPEVVKKPIVTEVKKEPNIKPKTVEITKEFSQEPTITKEKEAKLAAEEKALAEKVAKEKKEQVIETKRLAKAKVQQEIQAKRERKEAQLKKEAKIKKESSTNSSNGYFIQVGSFTKAPSSRFLAVIKNAGFNYQITPASNAGTKKLLIGPYGSRAEAGNALVRVKDRINKSAFVIKK